MNNASASTPACLGTALAVKNKAVADIVAGSYLNTESTYTAWKVEADKAVGNFALAAACKASEVGCYHFYDATYTVAVGAPNWTGGAAGKTCKADGATSVSAVVAGGADAAACQALCTAKGADKAWDPASASAPAGNTYCTGVEWDSAAASDNQCKLMFAGLGLMGNAVATTSCFNRDQSVYLKAYATAVAAAGSLKTSWYAKYDGTAKWLLLDGTNKAAYQLALTNKDVA